MSELKDHIVDYFNFCKNCKYWDNGKDSDICGKCLESPSKEGSRTPIHYEED